MGVETGKMIKTIKIYVKGNATLLPLANKIIEISGFIRTILAQKIKGIINIFTLSKRIAPLDHCEVRKYIFDRKLFEDFVEIYSPHEIYRGKPQCIDDKIHWRVELEYHKTSPAVFVVKLHNGRLFGNSGTVITEDNVVLEDISRRLSGRTEDIDVFKKILLPQPKILTETVGVISTSDGGGFFHWMFDVLPRIAIINQSPWHVDKIVVNSINSKFQEETLRILGILDKIIIPSKNEHLQASELVVPSLPGNSGNMPQWVCDFLRRSFLPGSGGIVDGKKKRLYISRAKASNGRKVLNESEVMDLLAPLGFEMISPEDLSFQEQVCYFSQAEVVIAPHGAGLSNLVFCDEKTKVLEFFSPDYVNACYYALANMVGLEYYYLIGEGIRPPEHCDLEIVGKNITVNIVSLQKLLCMMRLLPANWCMVN